MTDFTDVQLYDVFTFPDGEYRFDRALNEEVLLFQKLGNDKPLELTKQRLEELRGDGRVKKRPSSLGTPLKRKDVEVVPIDISPRKLLRARTMQYCVRAYDNDPDVTTLGVVGIRRFLQSLKPECHKLGLTEDIQPAAFIVALKERGKPGWRPLHVFISQTGLYDRLTRYPDRTRVLNRAVELYWSKRGMSKGGAFSFFRNEMRKINNERKEQNLTPIPVPRRGTSVIEAIDAAECWDTWRTKYSKREADAQYRGVAEAMRADKVGELVIIDHTVLDSHVMLDTQSGIPLGRPTLTAAIDVFSRAILAYFISPEPPSIYSVVCVLKLINQSKTHFHDRFPDSPYKWNSRAKPVTVLVDNGTDFISPAFQQSLLDAGIEILHAPIANGPFKAYGERFFGTLNDAVVHHLPGAVFKPAHELSKEGIDPRKDNVLAFDQIDELMYDAIGIYEQREHTSLEGKSPAQVFASGLQKDGRKMLDDASMLDHLVGNIADVVISKDGITFRNCQFHDTETTSYILNAMARMTPHRKRAQKGKGGAKAKVKIKYNPADCSSVSVYLPSEDGNTYVSLPNRKKVKISFWHHDQVFNFAMRQGRDIDTEDQMHAAIDDLRRKMEAFAILGKGKSARTAGRILHQKTGQLGDGRIVEAALETNTNDIPVEPFALKRVDANSRPKGVSPGRAKAAQTRKRNDKARAVISSFDDNGPLPVVQGRSEIVAVDFTKLAGRFK